jgi:hypothetical protein
LSPSTSSRHTPRRRAVLPLLAVFACACIPALAQTVASPPPAAGEVTTLHVYTNLLQIPVLVLDSYREPVKPIKPEKFTVQFDGGTPFRPRVVRLQGDDPITLAILIDGSRRNALLPELTSSLVSLVPKQLRPKDHVVVYSMDGCHLLRHGDMLPVQETLLRTRVEMAFAQAPFDRSRGLCASDMTLWKSMAVVADSLSEEPGRRILLAVTDGIDNSQSFNRDRASQVATTSGVAIFSIAERGKIPPGPVVSTPSSLFMSGSSGGRRGGGGVSAAPMPTMYGPSNLTLVSEGTGGMVLETDPHGLPSTLDHFISLLRGRYIVEFNRPSNLSAGGHLLNVGVGQPTWFIRSAGTSMPLADPSAPDPTVEHGVSDPTSIDPARLDATADTPASPSSAASSAQIPQP